MLAIYYIVAAELVGIISGLFTIKGMSNWYPHIIHPSFSPPNWVFGPVWTILYALIGLAAYLVHHAKAKHHAKHPLKHPAKRSMWHVAMWLYWAQLIFNFLWSIIFFGQRNIGLALVDLIFLWIVVAIITVMFFKIHKPSGWLFLPYIIWISFALALNISLWTLNQNPVMNPYLPYVTPPTSDVVNDVVFICSNNKSVRAVFHTTEKVNLTLSDGRAVVLPLGRSADGARYVNADESFVFWNVGNTATIQENGVTTYDGCSTK